MKQYVRSTMDEVTPSNVINIRASKVWRGPQADPNSTIARDLRVGDVVENTESDDEIAIGKKFVIMKIEHKPSQFHALHFTVQIDDDNIITLHYAPNEPVGRLIS